MAVTDSFLSFLDSLDSRTPEVDVLVEAGMALALEIDTAQMADANGKTKSAAAAVSGLSRLLDDLILKGRAVVQDPDAADSGWAAPTSVADLAAVRDAAKSGPADAGPRGGRGRKKAS